MDISELQAMGAFVSKKPVKRTIEVTKPVLVPAEQWLDPSEPEFTGETETVDMDVHFRLLSFADQLAASKADDGDRELVMLQRMIATPDGAPVFESLDQVRSLDNWLVLPLMQAAGELLGKNQNSKPATSSGSS